MLKDREKENTMKLINISSKMFRNHMRGETEKAGINDTYRPIIMLLNRENYLTQLEISKKICISTPTVSLTLQKMEMEGLVERVVDEFDKRQVRISITDGGREYFKKIKELINKVEDLVFEDISEEEQLQTNEILRKIINKFIEIGGLSNESF